MKLHVMGELPDELERQRQSLNDLGDKCDYTSQKLATIEKYLPDMIKEIMEYYFDKKVADTQGSLVTMEYFN
jgi:hypothetical protein